MNDELIVSEIEELEAHRVDIGDSDRYLRVRPPGGWEPQWLIPLTGPVTYGFKLVVDDDARDALEAAYQVAKAKVAQ